MSKFKVDPVKTKRNRDNQLVLETTVSRSIEDRLQKQADEMGLTLEEYIQRALIIAAKCDTDDDGKITDVKRKYLLPEKSTNPDANVRYYKCPHCHIGVYRKPKDYGKVDETLVTMYNFCEEIELPKEIKEYLSAVSKRSTGLLSLIGTSDGHLKAAAKVEGVNYYERETLRAYLMPKLESVRQSINRIKTQENHTVA